MAAFLDKLTVTEISDKIFAVADHPFRYESDVLHRILTVPVDFYTDFASVPRWTPLIYACLGDTAHEPAVVHDWLYYAALCTREEADDVLFEAMQVAGVSCWRRYPIWWGVRLGGWAAWNEHRRLGDPQAGKFKDTPDIAGNPALKLKEGL